MPRERPDNHPVTRIREFLKQKRQPTPEPSYMSGLDSSVTRRALGQGTLLLAVTVGLSTLARYMSREPNSPEIRKTGLYKPDAQETDQLNQQLKEFMQAEYTFVTLRMQEIPGVGTRAELQRTFIKNPDGTTIARVEEVSPTGVYFSLSEKKNVRGEPISTDLTCFFDQDGNPVSSNENAPDIVSSARFPMISSALIKRTDGAWNDKDNGLNRQNSSTKTLKDLVFKDNKQYPYIRTTTYTMNPWGSLQIHADYSPDQAEDPSSSIQ